MSIYEIGLDRRQKWRINRKERYSFLHVTVDKEEYADLKVMAEKQGKSISELVRTYITWGMENDK